MNSNPFAPGGEGHRLVVLLLVAVTGVVAAQNQAWASALGTAAAVYAVMSTGNPDRRS
ncbi:hypothetical protein [Streptomyces apocyni]|uniref:hypothetical protein n=1 Tax=Streptomyces apocyni TaxID=2654677 RepID=UPI0012E9DAB7|nr:hypothetical protein [Streptomyces apocyni]